MEDTFQAVERLRRDIWSIVAVLAIAFIIAKAPRGIYTKCEKWFADCTKSPFTYVGVTAWVAGLSILESRVRNACRVSLCVYVPLTAYKLWRGPQAAGTLQV